MVETLYKQTASELIDYVIRKADDTSDQVRKNVDFFMVIFSQTYQILFLNLGANVFKGQYVCRGLEEFADFQPRFA